MVLIQLGQLLFILVGHFTTMGLVLFALATVNQPLVYGLKDTLGLLGLAMLVSMLFSSIHKFLGYTASGYEGQVMFLCHYMAYNLAIITAVAVISSECVLDLHCALVYRSLYL